MYSVTVREHIMIAHSLPDPFFGPASQMHGATYVVDAEFMTAELDEHNVVIDIGFGHQCLKDICALLNYKNLDELSQFQGQLTTTEFLARYIFDQAANSLRNSFQGDLKITLHESHVAAASYQGRVG